jgi:thiamine transporter
MTRLRGQLNAVDPMNLNQIILAEGKTMKHIQENRNQIFPTKLLAEIIVLVALAGALSLLSHLFFRMPESGSINLGMVPILWLAFRRGPKIGVFAGAVFGFVDLTIDPFVVHPIQLVLDYPLAFAMLGLAGFFRKQPVVGVVVGITARFISHFVSGVVYFANYAPEGMNPLIYSAIYNGTYIIPSMIICVVIIGIMQKSKVLNLYL